MNMTETAATINSPPNWITTSLNAIVPLIVSLRTMSGDRLSIPPFANKLEEIADSPLSFTFLSFAKT